MEIIRYRLLFISVTSPIVPGPTEGGSRGGFSPHPPFFFGNFKELLRKICFQPPHFESLVSPPTFKVASRALSAAYVQLCFKSFLFITIVHFAGQGSGRIIKACLCFRLVCANGK